MSKTEEETQEDFNNFLEEHIKKQNKEGCNND